MDFTMSASIASVFQPWTCTAGEQLAVLIYLDKCDQNNAKTKIQYTLQTVTPTSANSIDLICYSFGNLRRSYKSWWVRDCHHNSKC